MKRISDRDSSPYAKRSRSNGRYDDSPRRTPRRSPRRRTRSRSISRGRFEEYKRPVVSNSGYRILCVSNLHPKASDDLVKDTLYREFKKYGEVTVKTVHGVDPEDRVAYVYFRNYEDARDAKHSKQRIILYDRPTVVEAVYETASRESREYRRSRTPSPRRYESRYVPRHVSPVHERRYEDRYDYAPKYLPPVHHGPPPSAPYRDYRRDVPPPSYDYVPRGPAPYHHNVPMSGPPHHGGGGRGYRHYDRGGHHNDRRDRFPNYLHHVSPEDDPLATRTLFAGNMEVNISDEEVKRIFGKYGELEDVDIKRPPPGTGNAYAFIRFHNLDQAHRCKTELSGQYIGKFQVKIGYGKATPTTKIWVGGLGSWTSLAQLEKEFDRFGAIKKIDYEKGTSQAYITYEAIEAAQSAVQEMRGFPLGGPDHRIRTDYAGELPPTAPGVYKKQYDNFGHGYDDGGFRSGFRGRGRGYRGGYRGGYGGGRDHGGSYERHLPPPPGEELGGGRSPSPYASPPRTASGPLAGAKTLAEIARRCEITWDGALILKNSLFHTKMHLTDGDPEIADALLKDEEGRPQLRITQRLRLDQPKLEDVTRRLGSAPAHAIFLGLPTSAATSSAPDDGTVQSRPLKNLVTYLKQKEAAGVITLQNKESEQVGVLYAFPPVPYAIELLKRTAVSFSEDSVKDDHLIVAVVKNA
ncbi:RNA-binding protein spenito-like isoform X2 [Artemia franciscana]|nr:hypothetical protein QYM36_000904 [Artemia franciscana]KAK2724199.1 hypothetical protein QYM36_000904 [Artemia franciscana]